MTWPICWTISKVIPVFYDANQPPTSKNSMAWSEIDQGSLLWRPGQVLLDSTLFWEIYPWDIWCCQAPEAIFLHVSVLECP